MSALGPDSSPGGVDSSTFRRATQCVRHLFERRLLALAQGLHVVVDQAQHTGDAGPAGRRWYALKFLIFSGLLVIGLKLRFIMREWTVWVRKLAEPGKRAHAEAQFDRSIRFGRGIAHLYGVGIPTVALLGAVKPL